MNTPLRDDDALFATLLERWVSGAFTRADEATLQRLIGDDTFRREVWEGFTALPAEEHAAALGRLRQRLAAAPTRRQGVGLIRYWVGAAAVLLLAGVLYWWWADAPASPERAMAPTLEWIADDSGDVTAYAAPEQGPEDAREHAYTAVENAPEATIIPEPSAMHRERRAVASQEGTSGLDTPAVLAYQDIPRLETPPSLQEAMQSSEIRRSTDHPAAPPPNAIKSRKSLENSKEIPSSSHPLTVGSSPGGRQKPDLEPLRPESGWPAFWQQYRQIRLLERTIQADTLRLQVFVRSDSTLSVLSVEPALSPEEKRRLEGFLLQYRWAPVTHTTSVLQLPVVH